MNAFSPAPLAMAALSARKANLGDAGERRRIDAFVMARDDAPCSTGPNGAWRSSAAAASARII